MPTTTYIDTHTHLNDKTYDKDRSDVIRKATGLHVQYMLDIGVDVKTSKKAIELSQEFPDIFASTGIHPHEASKVQNHDLETIESMLTKPKVVALGEIGLDYYYDFSPSDLQKKVFETQLKMAIEHQKPVIIHVRDAMQDALKVIDAIGQSTWKGVFHCFGGDKHDAKKILDRGFHISFTGVISFKNFTKVEAVQAVPLDRLLLETDCPYMTPVPFRGRRNEPMHVIQIAEKLAEFHDIALEQIAKQTTQNASQLFGLEG